MEPDCGGGVGSLDGRGLWYRSSAELLGLRRLACRNRGQREAVDLEVGKGVDGWRGPLLRGGGEGCFDVGGVKWERLASVGTLRMSVGESMVVRGAGGGAMVLLACGCSSLSGEFLELASDSFEGRKTLVVDLVAREPFSLDHDEGLPFFTRWTGKC